MKRYILTGAPGAGKTTIIRQLNFMGYDVVEEAATEVIRQKQAQGMPKPWLFPETIGEMIQLQIGRVQKASRESGAVQFHDRSIIDAYILGQYLGHPMTGATETLIRSLIQDGIYQEKVFLIEDLGFIEHTEARQISLKDAQEFGRLHATIYRSLGFQCLRIPAGPVQARVATILQFVENCEG